MSRRRHNRPQGSRRGLLKAGMAVAATSAFAIPGTAGAEDVRTVSQGQDAPRPLVRQNVKSLSDRQKSALIEAIHRLKRTQSPIDPTLNYYDQFVRFHQLAVFAVAVGTGPQRRPSIAGIFTLASKN